VKKARQLLVFRQGRYSFHCDGNDFDIQTLGVFASLYAGYPKPELRVTCSSLSSVINGVATIMMFVFTIPGLGNDGRRD
jgi:hypothetical protein